MTARRNVPSTQLTMFMAIEAPKPKPDIDALFAEFYAAYPRKREPDRARKAFEKALKRDTFDAIMQGVYRYGEECRRRGEPQFVKHPSTWLNAGCWRDEPDQPASSAALASAYRVGLEFRAGAGVRR